MGPAWLEWAHRLNALAQTGLTYAENPYDIERYTAIRTIAAEMIAHGAGLDASRVLSLLKFLLSGETDLDKFLASYRRR
jgi:hypothetical protein